jgi:hypothetical protein
MIFSFSTRLLTGIYSEHNAVMLSEVEASAFKFIATIIIYEKNKDKADHSTPATPPLRMTGLFP